MLVLLRIYIWGPGFQSLPRLKLCYSVPPARTVPEKATTASFQILSKASFTLPPDAVQSTLLTVSSKKQTSFRCSHSSLLYAIVSYEAFHYPSNSSWSHRIFLVSTSNSSWSHRIFLVSRTLTSLQTVTKVLFGSLITFTAVFFNMLLSLSSQYRYSIKSFTLSNWCTIRLL
jgi:hypothetical protein